tara:strand:+ start:4750 stop:5655 length:906 start_codon:yes stop_codon:yes gene_type:complete
MSFKIKNIEISLGSIKEKNLNLEKRYKWPKGQILNKIGIKQRHISSPNQNTTILAKRAVKKILKANNLSKVKFIISVTNTPTRVFPSLAHEIASLIDKSKNFMCIGLNAGCTGYVDALYLADKLIKENQDVLIITSDTYSKYIDINDKSIRPIFSDGASCTHLQLKKKNCWKIEKEFFHTERNTIRHLELENQKINMNGPEVLSFALRKVLKTINSLLDRKNNTLIFAHQAGKIVVESILSKVKANTILPTNYKKNGNLVSTSIPFLIKDNLKLLKKNKSVLISGFGVGLSHSHILIRKVN